VADTESQQPHGAEAVEAAVPEAPEAVPEAAEAVPEAAEAVPETATADSPGPGPAQATLPHVDTRPVGAPRKAPAPEEKTEDDDVYQVKLDMFEGPLDLLLHLIRKHELDILDIPVGFITEKYLEYLDLMAGMHIDVASEYLVMAATLTHIKSKMLLPPDPTDEGEDGLEEEEDPRRDLVRRLLEYQKYKDVAHGLNRRDHLGRDLFERGSAEPAPPGMAPLARVGVFRLFDAFEQVLKRANQTADHQVLFERVSIADRIVALTELLHDRRRMRFEDLFLPKDGQEAPSRYDLVLTFLALLEMCKMRVTKIVQDEPLSELIVEFSAKRLEGDALPPPAQPEQAPDEEGANVAPEAVAAEELAQPQQLADAPRSPEQGDRPEQSDRSDTTSDEET